MATSHLSEHMIENLKLSPGQRKEYQDDKADGLFVRAYGKKNGTVGVVFWWRRLNRGKPDIRKLGKHVPKVFGVKEARIEATKLNGKLAAKSLDAPSKTNVPTLKERWKHFRDHALVNRVRPRSLQTYDGSAKLWAELEDDRINRIGADDVKALHAKLGESSGPRAANMCIDLLARVWEDAADSGHVDGRNPCKAVKRFKVKPRRFEYKPEEVQRFYAALEDEPLKDLFILMALTGVRKNNALKAHRNDFDLDAKTWTIPGDQTKSGRPIKVQLVDRVVEIVQRRKRNGYLFPPLRSDSKTEHIANISKTWDRIRRKAQLPHWTPHTLRKLWATIALMGGASPGTLADGLGHGDLASQDAYAYSTDKAVREAADYVAEVIAQTTAEKVEP